jgi:hypothetical protein
MSENTSQWRSPPVVAWTILMAAAIAGPLARPGYVLLRDLVATPRQWLTPDALGIGDALPRAVPADAVAAAVTTVVDGAVLQRVILAAVLVLAGLGAARLTPGGRWEAAASSSLMVWNAYMAERLLMGHWWFLLGYSALPWLVAAALRLREGERRAVWALVAWLGLAGLTPGGGVLALVTVGPVLVWPGGQGRWWRTAVFAGTWLVVNAPWWLPGSLHPSAGASDPAAVSVFAARSDSRLGVLGSLAAGGGIWNTDAVPESRDSVLAAALTLVLLFLGALGFARLRRAWSRTADGLAAAAILSVCLAGWGAWAEGSLEWVVAQVPGGGLLRDGQRLVAPLVLLLAVTAPLGARRLAERAADRRVILATGVSMVLAPVLVLPDLAWGALGRLEPTRYPDSWVAARQRLEESAEPGDVVSLPWQPLRSFPWNGRKPVLDPAPRFVPSNVLMSSDLPVDVDGELVRLSGESERSAQVGRALSSGRPAAETLPELGVRWLLVARDTPGAVPAVTLQGARPILTGGELELWRLPPAADRQVLVAGWPAVVAVDVAALLLVAVSVAMSCRSPRRAAIVGP